MCSLNWPPVLGLTSVLTFPPAFQLSLLFLDHDVQTSGPLFLLLILLLPLFSSQLQVHRYCVLNGLCPKSQIKWEITLSLNETFGCFYLHRWFRIFVFAVSMTLSSVPLSEHERGLGFSLVVSSWGTADNDGGSAISSQRVLQDPGHLTVSVWNMGFLK